MRDVNYQIKHLTIKANNEIKMRAFYRDILKLVETKTDDQKYSYSFVPDTQPFLTLNFSGVRPNTSRQGLYHFAILLPDKSSLASLIEHLLLIKYPMGAGDHDVSEAFYLNDPNQNGIELYYDRPIEQWYWNNNQVTMGTKDVDVISLLKEKKITWNKFPSDTTLGHIHFVGDDLLIGDTFFKQKLNMDITTSMLNQAHFYSNNRYHHHHAYNTWLGKNVPKRAENENGLVNWTVLVDTRYFKILKENFDGQLIFKNEHSFSTIDPFNATLIVKKREI